jgi:hypothetical protein
MKQIGLSNDEIRNISPAVFAVKPHEKASDKYVMVHTEQVIDGLRDLGWYPWKVQQTKVRRDSNNGTQSHMLRFRQEHTFSSNIKDDEIMELLVINGHDTKTSLSFFAGIFRVVCGNGMVVMQYDMGSFKIKHIHIQETDVKDLMLTHAKSMARVQQEIQNYKQINLTQAQQLDFADAAGKIFEFKADSSDLLVPRRKEDDNPDLWSVFNRVQENYTKGGIVYKANKRITKTRPITSIKRDINSNLILWGLLANFYNHVR